MIHMHSNCRNLSKIMFRHHMCIHVGKLDNVILIKLACGLYIAIIALKWLQAEY